MAPEERPKPRFRKIQSFETEYAPCTISQYVSERSGMQVIVADRQGPKVNGYFTLATEILDDSGAPHTLEHLKLILGFSVGQFVFESLLSLRQYQVLRKTKAPKVLENEISQETFDKSQAYGRAKQKYELINGLWGQIQNIAFIQLDVLPKLWSWTGDLLLKFAPARFTGEISHSIVFVLTFVLVQQALSLPSSIYYNFVLEEKFGFNKQTPKLFVTDMLKSNMLT
ncbi:hypothetical protein BN1723_018583, partial [Verticillium longisporum]